MLLAEMEIRYRFGVVVQLNAVHFVYNNGNGAILVADLVEVPEELDGCIAPVGMLSGSFPRYVEQKSVRDVAASVRLLAIFGHMHTRILLSGLERPLRERHIREHFRNVRIVVPVLGPVGGTDQPPALSRSAQQRLLDGLRKAINDGEVRADRARRLGSAKFPILQCASAQSETVRELRLR
jgi:hypothetical protein